MSENDRLLEEHSVAFLASGGDKDKDAGSNYGHTCFVAIAAILLFVNLG